jgi:small-conductance mechanosensitive channel
VRVADWLAQRFELGQDENAEIAVNLALSLIVVLVLVGVWILIVRSVSGRVEDASAGYRARKAASYALAVVGVLSLLWVWFGALRELGTFLGLLSAGIAIALGDLLRNIAGWAYLIIRRPYRVDDRIQVGEVAGDVIDIRLFRTTLLEIGNWVDADQSTGRIVHIPNGQVLSETVFNATEGFSYLWHEIPVLITFESDWHRAEQMVLSSLEQGAGHTVDEARARIRRAARSYNIRYTHLTPTVYLTVKDSGILLTGRILVDTRRRRAVDQQVWRLLLEAIAHDPSVELAYPTTRTYLHGPIRLANEAAPTLTTDPREEPT